MHTLFRHFFSLNGLLCLVAGGMVFVNPQTANSQPKKATDQVSFQVTPECRVSELSVLALSVLDVVEKGVDRGDAYVHKSKLLVYIHCHESWNECIGFQIKIWDETGRNQVDTVTATAYKPLSLVSKKGKVATVERLNATFTVDAGLGKLSMRSSSANTEITGEGRCPYSP